jgi:hypothetical protein
MKSIAKIWVVLAAALTMAAFTVHAQTDSTTTNTPPVAKKKAGSKQYRGKIASVDGDAKTITFSMASGTQHTIKVTSKTHIKKDGDDATFADAAVGLAIRGAYHTNDTGDWIATTVNIGNPAKKAPATPPPADKPPTQ